MSTDDSLPLAELQSSLKSVQQLRRSALFSVILMLIGTAVVIFAVYYSTTRLGPLNEEIIEKQRRLIEIEQSKATLEKDKARLETEIKEYRENLDNLNKQKEELERSSRELTDTNIELQSVIQTVKEDPEKAGIKAYHRGEYEKAVEFYNKKLTKDPDNAYILNLKGYSLFKAGKYDQALSTLQQSVKVDPGYAWGYFDLARVYCKVNNYEDALNAARRAIQLRPDLKNKILADQEFTGLCKPIVNDL